MQQTYTWDINQHEKPLWAVIEHLIIDNDIVLIVPTHYSTVIGMWLERAIIIYKPHEKTNLRLPLSPP